MTRAALPLATVCFAMLGGCKAVRSCPSWIEPAPVAPTASDLALPVIGHIVDTGLVSTSGFWSEYGTQKRSGTLGPFGVEYDAFDYKGLSVTTATEARIFAPTCPGKVIPVKMWNTVSGVDLRRDEAHDLYFISTAKSVEGTVAVRIALEPPR